MYLMKIGFWLSYIAFNIGAREQTLLRDVQLISTCKLRRSKNVDAKNNLMFIQKQAFTLTDATLNKSPNSSN